MNETKSYAIEKRFKEVFGSLPRTDLYIRETPTKTYLISVPDPSDGVEYVLSTWENPKTAREFVDLGRCVQCALKMGAASIHFDLVPKSE